MRSLVVHRTVWGSWLAALLLVALAGCSSGAAKDDDPEATVVMDPPKVGVCRPLTPQDVSRSSNTTEAVPCSAKHTAETFAVGNFPSELAAEAPDSAELGAHVFSQCQPKFQQFLGGDESLVLRSTMTWAWFRPSKAAWEKGAHWWRCDVVGGGEQSKQFVALPKTAKGLLLGKPDDRWLVCVDGPTVNGSVKIPCSEKHVWRAVTTIVLGKKSDAYPGDRLVEVRTRDFCSDSVGAWLNYPVDYEFGFTFFHEAEWKAGNRRSVCWAKTTQ